MKDLISLRNIIASDKDIIFKWISDPEIRKYTGTKGPITIESCNGILNL